MNAIAEVCIEETTLQEEYKAALSVWSAARALNPEAPEVMEATKWLDQVEQKLRNHRAAHGC